MRFSHAQPAACIDDILSHHDRAGEPPAACSPTPAAASSSAASGPTTAVFYSISSSQPGLKGIELGHFLIQRVAERLTVRAATRLLVWGGAGTGACGKAQEMARTCA